MTNSANDIDKDQANELRELFKEVTSEETLPQEVEEVSDVNHRVIDVLNLPPRKEVHTSSGPMKMKMSKPLMRFIFISLLVITIIIVALYFFDGEITNLINKL
ncbi:hypothetical protein [Oceanobacillus sp. CAU 1775]